MGNVELQQASDKDFKKGEGIIKIHTKYQYKSRKLVTFNVLRCILFDNGAFTFEAREQLNKGVQVMHNHFYLFRIDMHVGKSVDGKIMASKTKCVLFLTPKIIDNNISSWKEGVEVENANSLSTERALEEREKKRSQI